LQSVLSNQRKEQKWLSVGHIVLPPADAGVVICLGQGADLHMAQLMPLPLTVSCSS